MKNPVLFLDIDGVLNSAAKHEELEMSDLAWQDVKQFHDPRGFLHYVEIEKLQMLLEFIEKQDALVVGVSSWFCGSRNLTPKKDSLNRSIAEFLGISKRFLGTTKSTGGGLGRGDSVLEYVKEHDIKIWAVIDDGGESMYRYRTRKINGRYGLHPMDLVAIGWKLEDMAEGIV